MFGPRHRNKTAARAGFTLIEVLVALAVIALALPVVGTLLANNVKGTIKVEQRLKLVAAYRSLEAGLLDRSRLVPGLRNGKIEDVAWSMEIDAVPEDVAGQGEAATWVPRTIVTILRSAAGETMRFETIRLGKRGAQ